jgi:hypothetical protein
MARNMILITTAYTEFFLLAVNNSEDITFINKVEELRKKHSDHI